jgi:hypothetical protein
MTPQAINMDLYLNGAWVDQAVGGTVLLTDPIKITQGTDTDGALRPAGVTFTFNNDSRKFDPSNPQSILYGLAGRNTPLRVWIAATTRQYCEVSSYEPIETADWVAGVSGLATTAIVAEGISRRLAKWTDRVRSPMYYTISTRANSVGHWPLEDSAGTTQPSNTLSGGQPGSATNVTFGDSDVPAGAETSAVLGSSGGISGVFQQVAANVGWQISWSIKLAALPGAGLQPMMSWTTTNGYRWWWDIDSGGFRITCRDRDSTLLFSTTSSPGAGVDLDKWISYRLKVTASGGTVTVEPAWFVEDFNTTYGVTGTFSGTTGALQTWITASNSYVSGARLVHVFGVTTGTDVLNGTNARRSFNGFEGETAGYRFDRLCNQFGIPHYFIGTYTDTALMGAQRPMKFLELLQECATTDDALLFDERAALGLTFFTRKARYNQTVALALTFPTHVAYPLKKRLDDALTVNSITVKNVNGGEATAVRSSGALSILPPPAGVGEYKGGDVTVNYSTDAPLQLRAGWELAKGTIEGARYPLVRVDALANPGLPLTDVAPGSIISITGKEPDPVLLVVLGIEETIGHTTRAFEFTCVPAANWFPAKYDDTTRRYDSRATTLQTARTTTQTAWTVTYPTPSDAWTVKPASLPFDLLVAGERVTVTAVGAVTGSGPYTQTMTVTRSANGIVKAQAAGAEIHVFNVARYAL